jgi:hypothetical protein
MPRLSGGLAREIAAWSRRILSRMLAPQSAAAIYPPCGHHGFPSFASLTAPCAQGVPTRLPLASLGAAGRRRFAVSRVSGLDARPPCAPVAFAPLRGSSVLPVLSKNAPGGAPATPFLVRPWRTRGPAALRAAPGFLAGIRGGGAPSQGRPFGLPSLRSAPPLPLRSSVPKKPGAARFARAGGASPPVRRTPPWGGLGLGSSLQDKGHANLSATLRGRSALSCPLPCAHRSTPPASAPPGPRPRGSGASAERLAPPSAAPRKIAAWFTRGVFDIVDCWFCVLPLITTRHPCRVMARIPGKTVNPGSRPFGS